MYQQASNRYRLPTAEPCTLQGFDVKIPASVWLPFAHTEHNLAGLCWIHSDTFKPSILQDFTFLVELALPSFPLLLSSISAFLPEPKKKN